MLIYKLNKKMSRKNLYEFIQKSFDEILKVKTKYKVLNIGSGGEIQKIIKKNFDDVYEIDIDPERKPDQVIDMCSENFISNLNYKPNIVCAFEVLEHTTNPLNAVENIYNTLNTGDHFLISVPFIMPIHDEPRDFYRFTKYGLKLMFKKFSDVEIYERNGWLEAVFVILVRMRFEKNFLSRIFGNILTLISYILIPFFLLLQKIFPSNRVTTGYFLKAKK
jgi:SAM-dependent methyltransferase